VPAIGRLGTDNRIGDSGADLHCDILCRTGIFAGISTPQYTVFYLIRGFCAISFRLSRPEASLEGWLWLPPNLSRIADVGIVAERIEPQRLPWITRLIGSGSHDGNPAALDAAVDCCPGGVSPRCFVAAGDDRCVRRTAVGGTCGNATRAQCTDDSPLFVATWYPIAVGFVAAEGALAGSRWLRF
jgi:hypothetical protein